MNALPPPQLIRRIVEAAIAEDLSSGDATTAALIGGGAHARAVVEVGAEGVMCGGPVARAVFEAIDPCVAVRLPAAEGARVGPGAVAADLEGPAASILAGERTALNFLQRLGGVATLTARYVAAIEGTGATIVDTRKTLPGLRALDKYAVSAGGGRNHRMSASDGMLIKDNHLAALAAEGVSLGGAVARARSSGPHTLRVEVEVEDLGQLREALDAGADIVMLDNMDTETMARAVEFTAGRAVLEASGGVGLDTARQVAETGVDLISVGALTHSAPALDMSLRVL